MNKQQLRISFFVWDDFNLEHIKKHNVSVSEILEAISHQERSFKTYNRRVAVIGKTKRGRILTMIMFNKRKDFYYVVSARDSSKKERKLINNNAKNSKV